MASTALSTPLLPAPAATLGREAEGESAGLSEPLLAHSTDPLTPSVPGLSPSSLLPSSASASVSPSAASASPPRRPSVPSCPPLCPLVTFLAFFVIAGFSLFALGWVLPVPGPNEDWLILPNDTTVPPVAAVSSVAPYPICAMQWGGPTYPLSIVDLALLASFAYAHGPLPAHMLSEVEWARARRTPSLAGLVVPSFSSTPYPYPLRRFPILPGRPSRTRTT